jgi:hypothetical protein
MLMRSWEAFLYTLKAGPAGGRLRRPSSAGRPPTPPRAHKGDGHVGGDGTRRHLEILQEAIKEEPPKAPSPDCGPQGGGGGER